MAADEEVCRHALLFGCGAGGRGSLLSVRSAAVCREASELLAAEVVSGNPTEQSGGDRHPSHRDERYPHLSPDASR
jgi:hypothetical protein